VYFYDQSTIALSVDSNISTKELVDLLAPKLKSKNISNAEHLRLLAVEDNVGTNWLRGTKTHLF